MALCSGATAGQTVTFDSVHGCWAPGAAGGGGSTAWSALTASAANLALSMGGFTTTFNHTSAIAWSWLNTTAATSSVVQSSPIFQLGGTCWSGSASAPIAVSMQYIPGFASGSQSTLKFISGSCPGGFSFDKVVFDPTTFGGGVIAGTFQANAGKTAILGAPASGYSFTGSGNLTLIGNAANQNLEAYAFGTSKTVPFKALSYLVQGNWTAGTITPAGLACVTATNTIGNCALISNNSAVLGVFVNTSDVVNTGIATVNLDGSATVTAGDFLCLSTTTAGTVHDNGTTACAVFTGVGVATATATGTTATIFVKLR
jgi:hypothetical protein